MRLIPYIHFAAVIPLVHCMPMHKRFPTDEEILNYALALEALEVEFYTQGIQNFSQKDFEKAGVKDPTFSDHLKLLLSEEKGHVHFLTKSLTGGGHEAGLPCKYSFPSTKDDPASFLALANMLEGTGIGTSAYLGAAKFITNKTHLTDAGSILAVEARHSAYLSAATGSIPFPEPFDIPLLFNEVYSLAAPFILSCPKTNPPLPVKAFPPIKVRPHGKIITGASVTIIPAKSFDASKVSDLRGAFVTATGPIWTVVEPKGKGEYDIVIPMSIHGQNYFVLNDGKREVNDDTVVAGPATIYVMGKMQPENAVTNATVKLAESV